MISDSKINAAALELEAVFQGMIEDGADSYAMQRAIFQALAAIARRRVEMHAASIASELSTRFGQAIAILQGKKPQ